MDIEAVTGTLPIAALAAFLALIAGYALGRRHARRARRELQRTLSARSIELLEARAARTRLAGRLAQEPRRERLLRLVLSRLRDSRRRERGLFVSEARLRLAVAESNRRARRAARLARLAAARARALESAAAATGTISIRAAKSYGNGEPVTVSVVDHETPAARVDGAARVPHRERARLARTPPSNEARRAGTGAAGPEVAGTAPGRNDAERRETHGAIAVDPDGGTRGCGDLGRIDGLAAADANSLRALGIHDLEQLATLSEHEQRTLHELIAESVGPRPLGTWIGSARALLGRVPTV